MASYNRVILVGNLTRDPELRYTPSNTEVTEMGLAVSEKFRKRNGEMTETVCFVDIVVWGPQAKSCAEYLSKGSPALVEGRLQFDQWQTKEGEKRSKLRVKADRVQFLGSPRNAEYRDTSAPRPQAGPPQSSPPPAQPDVGEPPMGDDDDLPF